MQIDKVVAAQLIEIFKAVADACDGSFDENDVRLVQRVYDEAMKHKQMLDFYGDLVDNNPFNKLV